MDRNRKTEIYVVGFRTDLFYVPYYLLFTLISGRWDFLAAVKATYLGEGNLRNQTPAVLRVAMVG